MKTKSDLTIKSLQFCLKNYIKKFISVAKRIVGKSCSFFCQKNNNIFIKYQLI